MVDTPPNEPALLYWTCVSLPPGVPPPPPAGVAHVPSPRQKVLEEAPVPPFICEVAILPERLLKAGCAFVIAPTLLMPVRKLFDAPPSATGITQEPLPTRIERVPPALIWVRSNDAF